MNALWWGTRESGGLRSFYGEGGVDMDIFI